MKVSASPKIHKIFNRHYGLLSLTILIAAAALSPATAMAEEEQYELLRTVNVVDEPRHRTVHRDGDIRLLDVQINPGDTSLPHIHNFAIMYTYISTGKEPLYGRVSSNTDYVTEAFIHRVKNEGPNLFRIIAMGNPGPAVPDSVRDRPSGMAAEPTLENPWFRSYRVELAPGESTALQTHKNPSVVVQVTDGTVHVSRADGVLAELTEVAHWAWRDAGSSYRVSNAGKAAVTVVINEPRRQSN